MNFARDARAVARIAKMLWQAECTGSAGTMIPRTTVSHGELPREQLRAARLAHGSTDIRAVEGHTLCRQPIDVGCLGILPSIQRQIIKRAIVCKDDEDMRFISSAGQIRQQ